jgi:hypothetical protein
VEIFLKGMKKMVLDNIVIVSRHPATIEWIAQLLDLDFKKLEEGFGFSEQYLVQLVENGNVSCRIPVITGNATPEDIKGRDVWGNIPYGLGKYARTVTAIEFEKYPPRREEMDLVFVNKYAKANTYTVQEQEALIVE